MLPKQELFARLGAGATVLTPNRRLAQALLREFDDFQIARGLRVWQAPDILPFGAFAGRLYEEALYSGAAQLQPLLAPAQEEQLWRQIVAGAGLLAVDAAAAQCRDAWNLANAWRIRPGEGQRGHARLPGVGFPVPQKNRGRGGRRPAARLRCWS